MRHFAFALHLLGMNANHRLNLLASLFVVTSLAACVDDDEFRSVEDQVELAVDTVEGEFPGYTVDRDALARAIETHTGTVSAPPPGPLPPPPVDPHVDPNVDPGQAQAALGVHGPLAQVEGDEHTEIPQLGLDMREYERREDQWTLVDPVFPETGLAPRAQGHTTLPEYQGPLAQVEGDEHTEIPQLGLDMREYERREDQWTLVDPVFPETGLAPRALGQSEPGPQRMIIALEGANSVEAPELEECLELCLGDYAECAGDELSPFACADQISACTNEC